MVTTKKTSKLPLLNQPFYTLPSTGSGGSSGSGGSAGYRSASHSVDNVNGMTLASGMTAGVGPEQQSNPRLGYNTPYARNSGNPAFAPLRIGVMRSYPGILPMPNGHMISGQQTGPTEGAPASTNTGLTSNSYYLFFLWNPNQIQVSMSMDPTQLPPIQLAGSIPLAPNSLTGQSVSWSLIFDRTYDIAYSPNPEQNRGVLRDVAALYNLVGTFQSDGSTPYLVPVEVVFGRTSDAVWGFTGYITSFDITYGIFKHNMIPARCEVQITMLARYIPQSIPAGTQKGAAQLASYVGADSNYLSGKG